MAKKTLEDSLKDRLKTIGKATAVDLNPAEWKARDKEQAHEAKPPAPDIRELGLTIPVRRRLEVAILEQADLNAQIKVLEVQKEEVSGRVKAILSDKFNDDEKISFSFEGVSVSRFPVPRTSINKQKLLDHGILPKVIDACTVTTTSLTLRITLPKED